jgi:protein O-mannosyl-transferase
VSQRVQLALAAAFVGSVTLVVFWPAIHGGVLNWDDAAFLAEARNVPLPQLLTRFVGGMFHPLTVLSFAVELRMAPEGVALFHATSVVIHAATSMLVLILLWQLTASIPAATLGALFWSIHPLRVESVAWLVERKDVLYGFFYVAALIAYVAHVRGRRGALQWTAGFFVLSLLSKVSAITFPLIMPMVDLLERRKLDRRTLTEKLPFLGLSVLFGVIGLAGMRVLPTTMPGFSYSAGANLLLSFRVVTMYLERTLVPLNLSALYPYPQSFGLAEWLAPLLVLALLGLALATLRWSRALAVAVGFFLVSVSITLPLFAHAWAVAADRYTYVASIGLAYLAAEAFRRWPVALVVALPVVLCLMLLTRARIAVWHDSVTLWSSVLAYDDGVAVAHNDRGAALAQGGLIGPARADFDRAIALEPCYTLALRNRALLSLREGRRMEAERDLRVIRICDGPTRAQH